MKYEIIEGIKYTKPKVTLLQHNGIGVSEVAARSCYDSFDNSENECVKELNDLVNANEITDVTLENVNDIESSELLDNLAWTYFHHSILEHAVISFLVRGTSRAVLQEHARHRIQAISVRSTRYTMSSVINAYISSLKSTDSKNWFINKISELNMLVTMDPTYSAIEIGCMYDKLQHQRILISDAEFIKISIAKSSLPYLNITNPDELYNKLQEGKNKRNVGDAFKHIVTDNFKVDMVVTFNIRSLKNYFTLRDSGAAYFGICWLAQEMKKVTPEKYLKLIVK